MNKCKINLIINSYDHTETFFKLKTPQDSIKRYTAETDYFSNATS